MVSSDFLYRTQVHCATIYLKQYYCVLTFSPLFLKMYSCKLTQCTATKGKKKRGKQEKSQFLTSTCDSPKKIGKDKKLGQDCVSTNADRLHML